MQLQKDHLGIEPRFVQTDQSLGQFRPLGFYVSLIPSLNLAAVTLWRYYQREKVFRDLSYCGPTLVLVSCAVHTEQALLLFIAALSAFK